MAIPLTINGVTFQYPQQFDLNWGPTLTNWSSAVTTGMLQKAGGAFTLTSEVDFGGSFGLKAIYLKSKETNIASTGILRLANASTGLVWRNQANSGDLSLTVNASNQLTFNGSPIAASASLTDSHIFVGNALNQPVDVAMTGDIGISNTGATSIQSGVIVNGDINASAAIAVSKLATLTVSRIVTSDGSGFLTTTASPTLTELGYVGGVTSAIQTQLNTLTANQANYLPLAGGTMSGAINMGSHKITSLTSGANTGEVIAYRQGGEAVNGSSANSGGSAGTIQQGTVSTVDLRTNAVTQTNVGATSATLTTTGGPVLVAAQADWSITSSTTGGFVGYDATFNIVRDGSTNVYSGRQALGGLVTGKSCIPSFSMSCIDTPSAGSHTYTIVVSVSNGVDNGAVNRSVYAIEFKK